MQVIELDWGIGKDTASAESETLAAWVEKLKDPHFERWLWMIDVLDNHMSDDLSTSLLGHGIEESMATAIASAENAMRAASDAMPKSC